MKTITTDGKKMNAANLYGGGAAPLQDMLNTIHVIRRQVGGT